MPWPRQQPRGEPRRAVDRRSLPRAAAKFADLDADAGLVAGPVVIRVFPLDVQRQALDRHPVIHGKVPRHVTRPVPFRPSAEHALRHAARMLICRDIAIGRAVDRDVARAQRKLDVSPVAPGRNDHLVKVDLPRGCGTRGLRMPAGASAEHDRDE